MTTNLITPNWTYLAQRTDPAVDGDVGAGPNAYENCGETALAMCAIYCRGVYVPVDTVADEILGPQKLGVTSVAALRGWCAKYCIPALPTSEHYPASKAALIATIKQYVDAGQPILELRYFQFPGNTALHWVVDVDYDDSRIYYSNPWSGTLQSETYSDHAAMSRYVLIGIDETRSPNL